jgi:hypothetical protein
MSATENDMNSISPTQTANADTEALHRAIVDTERDKALVAIVGRLDRIEETLERIAAKVLAELGNGRP